MLPLIPPSRWALPRAIVPSAINTCRVHADHGPAEPGVLYPWFWLPTAWQEVLWGATLDDEHIEVCPNVWAEWAWAVKSHGLNSFRHKRGAEPTRAERAAEGAVIQAQTRWRRALDDREKRAAISPQAVLDFDLARCGKCGGGFVLFLGKWIHECPKEPIGEGSGSGSRATGEARIRPTAGPRAVPNGATVYRGGVGGAKPATAIVRDGALLDAKEPEA